MHLCFFFLLLLLLLLLLFKGLVSGNALVWGFAKLVFCPTNQTQRLVTDQSTLFFVSVFSARRGALKIKASVDPTFSRYPR